METKVLLRLIRDDIKILDEINNSFINQTNLTCEEAEVALARAKALVMEFEMLSKNFSKEKEDDPRIFKEFEINSTEEKSEEKVEKKSRSLRNFLPFIKFEEEKPVPPVIDSVTPVIDSVNKENQALDGNSFPVEESATIQEESSEEEFSEDSTNMFLNSGSEGNASDSSFPKPESEITETACQTEMIESIDLESPSEKTEIAEEKIDTELLEETTEDDSKTLGETLGEKHKLVNDLLSQERSEIRFESKPLKSIREGIGINDQFLFIRELFHNNAEKYDHTLNTLDSLDGIEDAVIFLKQNFKWSKSEAGEKFLLLIKRRFAK